MDPIFPHGHLVPRRVACRTDVGRALRTLAGVSWAKISSQFAAIHAVGFVIMLQVYKNHGDVSWGPKKVVDLYIYISLYHYIYRCTQRERERERQREREKEREAEKTLNSFDKFSRIFLLAYCWWKRNPAPAANIKPYETRDFIHINWWRISFINGMVRFELYIFSFSEGSSFSSGWFILLFCGPLPSL